MFIKNKLENLVLLVTGATKTILRPVNQENVPQSYM